MWELRRKTHETIKMLITWWKNVWSNTENGTVKRKTVSSKTMVHKRTYHWKISFPNGSTPAITNHTRSFHGVSAALWTIQWDVTLAPRNSTCKATVHLIPQFFNGHNSFCLTIPTCVCDIIQTLTQCSQRTEKKNEKFNACIVKPVVFKLLKLSKNQIRILIKLCLRLSLVNYASLS